MNRNWIYGLFFVLASAVVIFNQTTFGLGIDLRTLILSIIIIFIIMVGVVNFNWFMTFVGIAAFIVLHLDALGLSHLNPVAIIAAAVFGAIGLGLLFKWPRNQFVNLIHSRHHENTEYTEDNKVIDFNNTFGSGIKYINTEDFEKIRLKNTFGDMKVFFDNATPAKKAVIDVSAVFGEIELYIPKGWNVDIGINNVLSEVDEKNRLDKDKKGPKVMLVGNATFSTVSIIYV